jgi:hypothetical protein
MSADLQTRIAQRIATELSVRPQQVLAAVQLIDEGATVPFIARYRKEVTDNLDDTQLRNLEDRLGYLRELDDRRATILASHRRAGQANAGTGVARSEPPTTSRASKTSTCPTNKSAAPRHRSPARPGWSRWPMPCSMTRR